MTNRSRSSVQQERLARAQQAFADYLENGSDLFDPVVEKGKQEIRRRALLLLDQRGRSRSELRDRLLRLDFDSTLVESVLDDLAECRLIDDALFASEWVRQRHQRSGKSRVVLDRELKSKGVSRTEREAALAQISEDDEKDVAKRIATKKASSIKEIPCDHKQRDKYLRRIVGMLARRGFSEGYSYAIAQQAIEERIGVLESNSL